MKPQAYQMYINGCWVDAISKETAPVYNPSNEELIASIQNGNEADAQKALEAAFEAQKLWKKWPSRKRAELMRKFADEIRKQKNI